jgi:hypothetical protein
MSWFAVGAAVVAGVGALSNAKTKKNAAEYNQKVEAQRSTIATQQATVNESAQRRRTAMFLGRQTAAVAENAGLSGTGLDLIEQSATEAELDALNIRYGGALESMSASSQATLYGMQAEDAETSGYVGAASSALSAYGGYTKGKK